MSPSDWIGLAALGVTLHISQRVANSQLASTIHSMFSKRLDTIESDNILRDEWISEVENKVSDISGNVKVLESRVGAVERMCDRRHELRANPGAVT